MLFFFVGLFPDAKAFEDGMEDFVGGDGAAGDFGKVEEGGAEVLANKVAGQAVAQAGSNAVEVGKGGEDGSVMALVGDDDVGKVLVLNQQVIAPVLTWLLVGLVTIPSATAIYLSNTSK